MKFGWRVNEGRPAKGGSYASVARRENAGGSNVTRKAREVSSFFFFRLESSGLRRRRIGDEIDLKQLEEIYSYL